MDEPIELGALSNSLPYHTECRVSRRHSGKPDISGFNSDLSMRNRDLSDPAVRDLLQTGPRAGRRREATDAIGTVNITVGIHPIDCGEIRAHCHISMTTDVVNKNKTIA